MSELLFSSDRYIARLFNPGRENLVVSFDYWRRDRQGFPEQQPVNVFNDLGFAQLSIVSSRNDWFLSNGTEDLMNALGSLRGRYATITHYGFSMGGFAAFLFAKTTGATRVIAISPQYSIDRKVVPFETRWDDEAKSLTIPNVDIAAHCPTDIQGFVVFDPKVELDRLHARKIMEAFSNVTPTRLFWGGHPATKLLHKYGFFGRTTRIFLQNGPAEDVEALNREALDKFHADKAAKQPASATAALLGWAAGLCQGFAEFASNSILMLPLNAVA